MIEFKNIEGIYFVGIGGIGMSALALYFAKGGFDIAGYDRSESSITHSLIGNGCHITFEDNISDLPDLFGDISNVNKVVVVYTPAVPDSNRILAFFRNNGYKLFKRSVVLGEISSKTDVLAVAGTHGKTTVSTMLAHLLKQSHVDCSAFLGGISKNYDTNLLTGDSRYTVIEADEYDRSFHQLNPLMAVITSLDADHLDIYGDKATMINAYNEFCNKIRPGGILVVNSSIQNEIIIPEGVTCYTYGLDSSADYHSFNIERVNEYYRFNFKTPASIIEDLHFAFPGLVNIENVSAAITIALMCGVTEQEIKMAVILFQGVKRRFDIRINKQGLTYIDDYAHHPKEIQTFITSVRGHYKGRKITVVFQPHLFSRTRDNADEFASSLDELDEVILLPIYPARENPIDGVSSELILDKMRPGNHRILNIDDIPSKLDVSNTDVLLTIGAGDICKLVSSIEEKLRKERGG